MIDPNSVVGELLEKGQNTTKAQVGDIANRLKGQIIGDEKKPSQTSVQDRNPQADALAAEQTQEMVKDLYSPSTQKTPVASVQNDAVQLANVRKQLQSMHQSTYVDPLFSYENKKREPTKAEEKEQDERQKMQELAVVQEKKNKDSALQMKQRSIETRMTGE